MKKRGIKIISLSLLCFFMAIVSSCSCKYNKVKITFVTEENSDIVKYVAKGKTLQDIPTPPGVKGKYCLWEETNFQNIQEDMVVRANCYSSVANLETNVPSVIDVVLNAPEADLDYIFKDTEMEVTFESGETKKLYNGDYIIESNGYNKGISGNYTVNLIYNNASKNVTIRVNKISEYVTAYLNSKTNYFSEGLPQIYANTDVEGTIAFDPDQTLRVGDYIYTWTFIPKDVYKYTIVKGSISVNLIKAEEISTNKTSLSVEFGTTEAQIIERLKQGLVVEARYGNFYREIDERYYTIYSDAFIINTSGVYNFRIKYDEKAYVDIPVTVNKCDNYILNANIDLSGTGYVYNSEDTLDDIVQYLVYEARTIKGASITGNLEFVAGQTLKPGENTYICVFTPLDSNYASITCEIEINI